MSMTKNEIIAASVYNLVDADERVEAVKLLRSYTGTDLSSSVDAINNRTVLEFLCSGFEAVAAKKRIEAAAPELLAALKAFMKIATKNQIATSQFANAEAAIAKAEGK